ncbi:MAG TPA: hypothetical protein VHG93_18845 [Longimicrobium sp.]|nr:hypothetical protein [Longimicrobium sp.]
MISTRRLALWAALPLFVLLQACPGKTVPGSRQDFDVSRHLPPEKGPWIDQAPRRAQVKVGPDSTPVTVELVTAHSGAHRGISRIGVIFPEHRESDTFSAAVSDTPANMGTTEVIMESLTLQIRWARDGAASDQMGTTTVHLKGDGTTTVL